MIKEEMTAKRYIRFFKGRIHDEIHDPIGECDGGSLTMDKATRSMCKELDALVRAVREDCAKIAESVPSCDCNMKTFMPNAHLVGCEQITANVIAAAIRGK